MLKRVAVYCGSSSGSRPEYTQAAAELGYALAARNLELVYGGSRVGLMGTVASAVMEAGGRAIGVLPGTLQEREIAHNGLSELHYVVTMAERKARMAELADAHIALPGGFGTMDEFFEALALAQIGTHRKACCLLNVMGYYDPLLAFIDHMADEGFLTPVLRSIVIVRDNASALLDFLAEYEAPDAEKFPLNNKR